MSATVIENIKGSDLPKNWANKINALPHKTYTITIQPQEEHETLNKIMSDISRAAQQNGMNPEILKEVLGTDIKHLL